MSSTLFLALGLAVVAADGSQLIQSTTDARQTWCIRVSQALREQATATANDQVAALTELARLGEELDATVALSSAEHNRLGRKIQRRLDRPR